MREKKKKTTTKKMKEKKGRDNKLAARWIHEATR